jgi:hypothetical protein
MDREILEKLAELEHKQWVYWSKALASTEKLSKKRLNRWQKMWRPYKELSSKMKEQDRRWAKRVLKIVYKLLKIKNNI